MPKIHPIRFVHAFLEYVNVVGIYDEFDPEEGIMKTSEDILDLISMAEQCLPERLEPEEAASKMRTLTEEERQAFIDEDIEETIIDMRNYFSQCMAENGGARGLLQQLVTAQERGDTIQTKKIMELCKQFTNVSSSR